MSLPLASSVPLAEVLPWLPSSCSSPTSSTVSSRSYEAPSTILVVDTIESDGRFLLYQSVATWLTDPRRTVLWLTSQPVSTRQIANGLNRLGCDPGVVQTLLNANAVSPHVPFSQPPFSGVPSTASHSRLTIRSITEELGSAILHTGCNDSKEANYTFDREAFVRMDLFRSIEEWAVSTITSTTTVTQQPATATTAEATATIPASDHPRPTSWIIVDNVSTLASLLGERLISGLLQTIQALCVSLSCGLLIQCNAFDENDDDSISALFGVSKSSKGSDWIHGTSSSALGTWQYLVAEMADTVVDVCSLQTGPTRDAHGRVVITEMMNVNGERSIAVFNYCLTDTKALALRIQQPPQGMRKHR